jgi:hypothetical protein
MLSPGIIRHAAAAPLGTCRGEHSAAGGPQPPPAPPVPQDGRLQRLGRHPPPGAGHRVLMGPVWMCVAPALGRCPFPAVHALDVNCRVLGAVLQQCPHQSHPQRPTWALAVAGIPRVSPPAQHTCPAHKLCPLPRPQLSTALTAVTQRAPPTQGQPPQCQCAGDTSARAQPLWGARTLRLGSTPPNGSSFSRHCKPQEIRSVQGSKPHVWRVVLAKLTHPGLACPSLAHSADRQRGLQQRQCWGACEHSPLLSLLHGACISPRQGIALAPSSQPQCSCALPSDPGSRHHITPLVPAPLSPQGPGKAPYLRARRQLPHARAKGSQHLRSCPAPECTFRDEACPLTHRCWHFQACRALRTALAPGMPQPGIGRFQACAARRMAPA